MNRKTRWLLAAVLLAAAFVLGFLVRGGGPSGARSDGGTGVHHAGSDGAAGGHAAGDVPAAVWTCSMHPQIRQPKPGRCPICGMDLIPVSGQSGGGGGPREIRLSETARRLAEIRTAPVRRMFVPAEVLMTGKVDYDESRLGTITARVPGRLDRLYVDFTGTRVGKGEHLADLYSPELVATQEELIQALKAEKELRASGLESIRETALATVDAVREKLRLWGLTSEQIEEIERRGRPTEHLTIHAPMGGIVIRKDAVEGMYVETGTSIYTIADLSRVWVKLDAYESDLPMVRYGQKVELRTEAFPGEVFSGDIAFIDPVLDDDTRTVKVRVNVPNREGRLKPGMFVRARIGAELADGGAVIEADLKGKWLCPMHPDVVKNGPGACDICGMDLVPAESLGYGDDDPARRLPPLIIPASAPLITGRRAVVYVELPGGDGRYEGREVELGPRAGDWYVVRGGLEEGEMVVVRGNFKIDSAVQIMARPSMMNPASIGSVPDRGHGGGAGEVIPDHDHDGGAAGHMADAGGAGKANPDRTGSAGVKKEKAYDVQGAFRGQLDPVYAAYFDVQRALSRDDPAGGRNGAKELLAALERVDGKLPAGDARAAWAETAGAIRRGTDALAGSADIDKARAAFEPLSAAMISAVRRFGSSGNQPIYRFHCPMAFDFRGADWLQNKQGVENPYFGSAMFACGTEEETLVAAKGGGAH